MKTKKLNLNQMQKIEGGCDFYYFTHALSALLSGKLSSAYVTFNFVLAACGI